MPTETVLAISDQEENAYQALLQHSSRAFKIFNTGDDVLDHLANNTTPQDRGCGGIGGRDHVSSRYYINGNTWYKTEMHFNRYGVYFVLKGGFDSNDLTGIGGTVLVEIKGPQAWCQRRPCGPSKIKTVAAQNLNYTGYHEKSYKFYQNTRNLNGFYFYVRTKVAGITTTWEGDNVNSPY